MIQTKITDGAAELVELAEILRKIPASGVPAYVAISSAVGLPPDSVETLALFGAVGARMNKFANFARELQDPFLDARTREHVVSAISVFASLFHPSGMVQAWSNACSQHIIEQNLAFIGLFSRIAQQHRPLRKLSNIEKKELETKITETINTLKGDADEFPKWSRQPLIEGLEQILFFLRLFPFFGYDQAIDQLLLVHQRSTALYREIVSSQGASSSAAKKICGVIAALVFVADAFALPHNVSEAYEQYHGWALRAITSAPGSSGPKLIEGPKREAPQSEVLAPARAEDEEQASEGD